MSTPACPSAECAATGCDCMIEDARSIDWTARGVRGSKGTLFLTPSVWMSHLQHGESVSGMEDIEIKSTQEFAMAVWDLQRQHTDMTRFLEEHVVDDDGEMGDAWESMTDAWEESRVV